jgi:hypothetical protein
MRLTLFCRIALAGKSVRVAEIKAVANRVIRWLPAMTKVSADNGWGTFVSYPDVAKASAAQGTRDATKILTIAPSHVEYSTATGRLPPSLQ